jgi:hypothetical protein
LSAVSIVTGYGLDGRVVGVRVTVRAGFFSSPCCPDKFWVPGTLFLGQSDHSVKINTHLQLVPTSGMRASIHPLSHTSSWRRYAQEELYFIFTFRTLMMLAQPSYSYYLCHKIKYTKVQWPLGEII